MKSGLKKSGRYNFFVTRDLIGELQTIHISQSDLPTRADTEALWRKNSKREQCTTETLIHNLIGKERVFLPFQRMIFVK